MSRKPSTFIDLLNKNVERSSHKTAFRFVRNNDEETSLTYLELHRETIKISNWISNQAKDKAVLILLPSGLDYVTTFLGCLHAGAVAIPAYPPRMNRNVKRISSIVKDVPNVIAVTNRASLATINKVLEENPEMPDLKLVTIEDIRENSFDKWIEPKIGEDNIAFLQYTSGSTSAPKGVMVSHKNLLHNENYIKKIFNQSENSIIVGWLPLYHDMGLIGNLLQPLYLGAECILMSPFSFLQRPALWLETITKYNGTTSGGPNFAFDLCANKISPEEKNNLDLSSWEVAFNGAEPINARTLETFADEFSPVGFKKEIFVPCYGLAESTLLVTGYSYRKEPRILNVDEKKFRNDEAIETNERGKLSLVSCGKIKEQIVKIVNPATLEICSEGKVGEIWVSGESVAKGYWNKPDETDKTFNAKLADDDSRRFLRTGDLGFIHQDELFVSGRLKDLIIIRGQNHYPQDIEKAVENSHPDLRRNSGAAFSINFDGEEKLVVVQEVNRHLKDEKNKILEKIRLRINEEEIPPFAIVLIKTGEIPKTSSGKIRRAEAREIYLRKEFTVIAEWREETISENFTGESDDNSAIGAKDWLRLEISRKSGIDVEEINTDTPILGYGIDSLGSIDLLHKIEEKFNVSIPLADILNEFSINDLAQTVEENKSGLNPKNESRTETKSKEKSAVSIGQEALWLIQKTEPENSAYNIPVCFQLNGSYDADCFEEAINEISRRHETLNSVFYVKEGELLSESRPQKSSILKKVDCQNQTEDELSNWIENEANRPFDLEKEQPFRAFLIEKIGDRQIVLLVFHHIAVDLWSLSEIFTELEFYYDHFKNSRHKTFDKPEISASYSNYSAEQKENLAGKRGGELWKYWETQLSGGIQPTNFPNDLPLGKYDSISSAEHLFDIKPETVLKAEQFCKEFNITPFALFLTVFKILLSRYSGQKEHYVATPTNGRTSLKYSKTVGYFVNPVIIRSALEADSSFLEYLQTVRKISIEAFSYQDYPYPFLVNKLQAQRQNISEPIFNVMFAMQQTHKWNRQLGVFSIGKSRTKIDFADFQIETIGVKINSMFVDLSLNIAETDSGIIAKVEYASDKFSRKLIERFSEHFHNLLSEVLAEPQKQIQKLSYLSPEETNEFFDKTAIETNVSENKFQTAIEYFESRVSAAPEKIALIHQSEKFTYSKINERANRLANFLKKQGVGAEKLVGVCLPRKPDLIVTLLAILKTGGGYVPLDPVYPEERLKFIIEDTDLQWIITDDAVENRLPSNDSQKINLDKIAGLLGASSKENPTVKIYPENVAYLIYTSGSTGRPKGVAIRHESFWKLLDWSFSVYSQAEIEKVLAGTSICFDLSVYEIFVPLSRGGTVILAENVLEITEDWAYQSGVTLMNTVPSAMSELVRLDSVPESVRTVNLAGEALPQKLVEDIYAKTTAEKVFNLYGPSEDTTYSTFALTHSDEAPPIGRELSGTQGYVLDEGMQLLPVGVIGELYLGGLGLARGYWNRPEITAERFVPHPFSRVQGERLYRTGDLVKLREDGQFDYLGRQDHQVKIRGYRIELGEIEEAVRQIEGVEECVVVTQGSGDKEEIVAFFAGKTEPDEIEKRLIEKLPGFMIPALEKLEQLPHTPNGKIDRKLLPQRTKQKIVRQNPKPQNNFERELLKIWAKTLGLKPSEIGTDDNFFALGGHSLLATRLAFQIDRKFSVEIPFRTIFDFPTIEKLAAEIEKLEKIPAFDKNKESEKIDPVPRSQLLPLSPAQERLWFLDQLNPDSPVYNMPVIIKLEGNLEFDNLERAVRQTMLRHEILRTKIVVEKGIPQQTIAPDLSEFTINFEDVSDKEFREIEAERLTSIDARTPFDLSRDLPIRVRVLKLAEDKYWLYLNIHHLAGDGWSLNILAKELTEIYNASSKSLSPKLDKLSVQYADFAVWQKRRSTKNALETDLNYWKKQLGGQLPELRLNGNIQSDELDNEGDAVDFSLPENVTRKIEEIGLENGATTFIVLLSAFQILLSFYSNQRDIIVGSPVAGRLHQETENLIGLFTNTLVLRNPLERSDDFRNVIEKNREIILNAQQHQAIPFEVLVDELQPERSLNRTPIFQHLFVMQDEFPDPKFENLESSLHKINNGSAKFDLTLNADKTGNGINCRLEYKTGLFDKKFAETFSEHFLQVLTLLLDYSQTELPLIKKRLDPPIENFSVAVEESENVTDEKADYVKAEISEVVKNYQKQLLEIWSEVLGKEPTEIEPNQNFFTIGGHSLLATRLLFHINRMTGQKLPLSCVFKYPTISEFSKFLDSRLENSENSFISSGGFGKFSENGFPKLRKMNRQTVSAPLSFAQQRLWLSDNLDDSASYNVVGGVRLKGNLDLRIFEQTMNEIVRRQESLSTVFGNENGNLYQTVEAPKPLSITFDDWSNIEPAEKEIGLQEEGKSEQRKSFDLGKSPLLRIKVIRLDENEHAVIAAMHHIISDGQSIAILLEEFALIYDAFSTDSADLPPPLNFQYTDYAYRIRDLMRGAVLEEHLDFWRKSLGGNLPVLNLPVSNSSEKTDAAKGKSFYRKISESLFSQLTDFKSQSGITDFVILKAAFFLLLHKYSKQKDIIVGTAVAGRDDEELEKIIGVFINMIPVRVNLSETMTFNELLGQVNAKVIDGLSYQQLPFDMLVEALNVKRENQTTPIFQVAFGLQETPVKTQKVADLEMSPIRFDSESARYDLTLWMLKDEHLNASWTYRCSMFDEQTIARMHKDFEEILSQILAEPNLPLSKINLSDRFDNAEIWKQKQMKNLGQRRKIEIKTSAGN